jgi:hypothetical protein
MLNAESELTTAEELLLLALDPESGRISSHPVELLKAALAGAVLMDLFRTECITLVDERIVAGADTGERRCDEVLARMRELPAPRGIAFWVDAFGYETNNAESWTISSLLASGMLNERKALDFIPDKRYTLLRPAARTAIVTKVLDILTVDPPMPRQVIALVVCASACGVLDAVVPHAARQAMNQRVRAILQSGSGASSNEKSEEGDAITIAVYSSIYSPGLGHGRPTVPLP